MPAGGRFSSSTFAPRRANHHPDLALRPRLARFRRGERVLLVRDAREAPLLQRTNQACRVRPRTDHRPQVHDRLGVRRRRRSCGVHCSASTQSFFSTAGYPDNPDARSNASARASRCRRGSGCRSPRASARIAPAVERPMPGSAMSFCQGQRKLAAVSRDERFAARCRLRARA